MNERILSPEEIRAILGAERPRRSWNPRRAAENLAAAAVLTGFGLLCYWMFVMMAGGK